MEYGNVQLPPQQLPFNKKTEKWKRQHLMWADSKAFFNYSLVRKSVIHKKINYDLAAGKLHMSDLELILNPEGLKANFIPDKIQHYPIINSKLELLQGEESRRVFDFRVRVSNPNSISEIENNKKEELLQRLQEWVSNTSQSEEEAQKELEKINDYYAYEWQDLREIRANTLLNHYIKEYNIPIIFNNGFMDALIVGEEIYQCDIVGGEPVITRLNPLKVRIFKSGYSNKIEDADMIIIEDYWSPGKIIDAYYDVLTKKDLEHLNKTPDHIGQTSVDSMDNVDERYGFINNHMIGDEISTESFFWDPMGEFNGLTNSLLPFDMAGNVRVLRMYWKSRRKIKKVKRYNPVTGEEEFNFFTETYVLNRDAGEEEEIYYINEAWEGTKIGKEIYVNIRPCPIQYNSMSNPSRCHFGIVGTIYNLNEGRPFSMVDRMKPFSYLYDVIHDRLNKLIARNWGTLVRFDFAKKPKGWDVEKWMYYAKTMGIAVEDSFNEGSYGASLGKVAGGLNNASTGVIPTNDANQIQQYINLLEFIKMEMSEFVGISKQREGQISSRETVGGVERATLQSSHITESVFNKHDDTKKRVLECFIETAKVALKGRNKKFQYILSDGSMKIMDIDGDEFAESDYGLVVDNSNGLQELNQKLDMLAQAALQSQAINFSTLMKIHTSMSMAEKQRIIEIDEQRMREQQAQESQRQAELQQQQMEQQSQMAMMQLEQQDMLNQRDNETRVQVAIINGEAEAQRFAMMNQDSEEVYSEKDKADLMQRIKEFDAKIKLDRDKFEFEKRKHAEDNALKDKISIRQAKKAASSSSK